jgi:hypothetical protein
LVEQRVSTFFQFQVMIWDPFQGKRVHNLETAHRGNIFSVKFLPMCNNATLVTGAADSKIFVFDINRHETPTLRCNCHKSRVKRLATAADQPFMFWSAAEDGHVFQFDLREPHHCRSNDKIMLINLKNHTGRYSEAKCIALNQVRTEQLVVGSHDCYARLYDRRMIAVTEVADFMDDTDDSGGESSGGAIVGTDNLPKGCVQYYCPGHLGTQKQSITHRAATFVTFSPNGKELLMNLGSEQIYLFDINNAKEPIVSVNMLELQLNAPIFYFLAFPTVPQPTGPQPTQRQRGGHRHGRIAQTSNDRRGGKTKEIGQRTPRERKLPAGDLPIHDGYPKGARLSRTLPQPGDGADASQVVR